MVEHVGAARLLVNQGLGQGRGDDERDVDVVHEGHGHVAAPARDRARDHRVHVARRGAAGLGEPVVEIDLAGGFSRRMEVPLAQHVAPPPAPPALVAVAGADEGAQRGVEIGGPHQDVHVAGRAGQGVAVKKGVLDRPLEEDMRDARLAQEVVHAGGLPKGRGVERHGAQPVARSPRLVVASLPTGKAQILRGERERELVQPERLAKGRLAAFAPPRTRRAAQALGQVPVRVPMRVPVRGGVRPRGGGQGIQDGFPGRAHVATLLSGRPVGAREWRVA